MKILDEEDPEGRSWTPIVLQCEDEGEDPGHPLGKILEEDPGHPSFLHRQSEVEDPGHPSFRERKILDTHRSREWKILDTHWKILDTHSQK